MNTLTKAFVVVVTILAVVLVALVVPFAAQVPDYAQQYKDLENELRTQLQASSKEAADVRAQIAEMILADEQRDRSMVCKRDGFADLLASTRNIVSIRQIAELQFGRERSALRRRIGIGQQ